MLLVLTDEGWAGEVVFADHHCDYPETYGYLDMLTERGFAITRLDVGDLYEWYFSRQTIPCRIARSCTDHFKVRPLKRYMKERSGGEWRNAIGFAADEEQRAANMRDYGRTGEEVWFPLIERNLDRQACIAVIRDHGMEPPPKSGCYFCPFQRKDAVSQLRREYPSLYCKARRLEQNCRRGDLFLYGQPLDLYVEDDQPDLYGWKRPCMCDV